LFIPFSSFQTPAFQKISKNRRTPDSADETDESKPNRRMIKVGVGFFFILFSQAIEERRFMKGEASCARPSRAT
jgi:hypothetical protein